MSKNKQKCLILGIFRAISALGIDMSTLGANFDRCVNFRGILEFFYKIIMTHKFYNKGEINVQDHKKNNFSLLKSFLFKKYYFVRHLTKPKY